MHHVGKQAARKAWGQVLKLAVFGVMGGSLVAIVGCEKMESAGRGGDRKVDTAVAESIGTADASKAATIVKSAMGDTSSAGKARGSSELARDEFNQAIALMPEINHQAQLAEGALFDLAQATTAINRIQAMVQSAGSRDPKDTLDKLHAESAQVDMSGVKAVAEATEAKTEIEKRQKEIADLKSQREKADAEAESLTDKSNNAKGEESVKLFKQAMDARTQAGTLAAQIEVKTAALMPFQRKQAIAEAADQSCRGANKDMAAQMDQISAQWQGTQQQAQALGGLAKKVVADVVTPGGAADHANAGARLAAALKDGDKARTDARKLLESAAQHADDALKAAKSLTSALKTRADELNAKSPTSADLASIKALMGAFDESQYALQKGNINVALGNVLADEAVLNSHAKQTIDALAAAMQASGQSAPGIAAPNPDAAKASAEKAYKEAEQALESVVNAKGNAEGMQAMKNAGLSSLLMARFGHYQLTLDDLTRAQLRDDISRAKESSVAVPNSLRGI